MQDNKRGSSGFTLDAPTDAIYDTYEKVGTARDDMRGYDTVAAVQAANPPKKPKTPKTPAEWRHRVFMEMPEDEAFGLKDLEQLISQKLSLGGPHRQTTHDKVEQAIRWNLDQGNLKRDGGRIRLATPQSDKTVDDFKSADFK